jgi:predicted O-linked N-acetylglucosamine transferase (SPINDLY family)
VFAPRVSPTQHLARHRLADLFLDTLPFNAHVTASDALWAGLPLVTCEGATFASRVAASTLRAAGLDELITTSLDDYERLALSLACSPDALARVRHKLHDNRLTCPLFDTGRFRGSWNPPMRRCGTSRDAEKPCAVLRSRRSSR